jgi:hypothetical protein
MVYAHLRSKDNGETSFYRGKRVEDDKDYLIVSNLLTGQPSKVENFLLPGTS